MYNIKKSWLQELLIGIYKTDRIKNEDSQIIIEEKSLLGKCDFSKTKNYGNYYNWFEEMFKLTFIKSDTFFGIDTEGKSCKPDNPKKGQIRFKTKDAINNAYKFLTDKGIDFSILSQDEFFNLENCEKIIFKILCIYLKYIFASEDNVSANNTVNGTSIVFEEAIPEIEYLLLMEIPTMGKYVHTTEDNSVVESDMNKADCNRYISIGINDLEIPQVVYFLTVNANIKIIKKKEPQKIPEDLIDVFRDRLMRDLSIYDPSRDMVAEYVPIPMPFEKDDYIIDSPERDFNISEICPDYSEIAKLKIFYLFKMDKDKIGAFYPEVITSYDLRKAIIDKANEKLRIPFLKKIKNYYIDVIDYIEDVLKRILSIDTEKMISGEVDDRIVSAFNIDYDYILEYLERNGVTSEKSLYLYMMLDRAINEFTKQITLCVDETARQIVKYIDTDRINGHIERLEEFISSDKIKRAILIQENDENEHPDNYSLITDDMTWNQRRQQIYKKKTKGLFKNLRCEIKTYLYWLRNTLQ
ncbi:MAG TPA: hypothetical protein P5092_11335 [Ruminococcus sp.]|mgnify:CR=1 FL=1|nr:hypothetical protein [Ruminococcus sp.]